MTVEMPVTSLDWRRWRHYDLWLAEWNFWTSLGDLGERYRCFIYTSRWKARDRLPVTNEHLASCYSWGTTSRNISNSALHQGDASLWRYIWSWRVSVPPPQHIRTVR